MNLAIDFDGTVVRDNYPLIGPELPGAIQTLKELQSQGHKLILWTCRAHDQKLLNEAIAWCTGTLTARDNMETFVQHFSSCTDYSWLRDDINTTSRGLLARGG